MTDDPRFGEAFDGSVTRAELLALRGEMEGRDRGQARELARVRVQVRELAAQVEELRELLTARPGQPSQLRRRGRTRTRHSDPRPRGQSWLALGWRLKAIGRWCARVWRTMTTREGNDTNGGTS